MDCTVGRDLLSAWLDGEVTPAEAERLSAHLRECSACREWCADVVTLTEAARKLPAEEQAPDLVDRIVERLSLPRPAEHGRRR